MLQKFCLKILLYIVTKFKDKDRNNEETDIEVQTVANRTVSNSKIDSDTQTTDSMFFQMCHTLTF